LKSILNSLKLINISNVRYSHYAKTIAHIYRVKSPPAKLKMPLNMGIRALKITNEVLIS